MPACAYLLSRGAHRASGDTDVSSSLQVLFLEGHYQFTRNKRPACVRHPSTSGRRGIVAGPPQGTPGADEGIFIRMRLVTEILDIRVRFRPAN